MYVWVVVLIDLAVPSVYLAFVTTEDDEVVLVLMVDKIRIVLNKGAVILED